MIDEQTVTALLPMKAHSARVMSKNFREIAGKPLFRWVLDTLLNTSMIDRVVINTDAREVLSQHGLHDGDGGGRVLIRDRREEICGDFVSMNQIIEDDLRNVDSDFFVMTHTTNPLVRSTTIGSMIETYLAKRKAGCDSLFSVNQHQTRFYTSAGQPINHDPENLIRTQDLSPYLEENSVFYAFSRASFAATGARIGERPHMYRTPSLESVDIDEPSDWFVAESLLQRVARGEALPES